MPMWPVHTWLPDAHVEAPTAGSVVLAAIMLKMGGYGFLRFSLPMFPLASHDFAPLIFSLSAIAIVYTSLVALMQEDIKKLIAYSSVAHMGFVTMGIFAGTMQGVAGGVFQMVVARHRFRRAVPLRRRRLRPAAYPRDRRLRRAGEPDAALCLRVPRVHDGQCRPAGHLGLRRRIPYAARHLQGQHSDRDGRDAGRDPVGGLCAMALSQGGVRACSTSRRSWASRI